MSRVLVDTSVWVDHFRQSNKPLIDLLILDGVAMHPLIIGSLLAVHHLIARKH